MGHTAFKKLMYRPRVSKRLVLSICLLLLATLLGPLQSTALTSAEASSLNSISVAPSRIFATKSGGREWAMNSANPKSDAQLRITNGLLEWDTALTAWRVTPVDQKIRLNVITPKTSSGTFTVAPWENVEITGYFRLVSTPTPSEELTIYGRTGRHSHTMPCEGSAYKGSAEFDGTVFFQKEIFHGESGAGYTDNPQKKGVTQFWPGFTPGGTTWVGMKLIIFNTVINGQPAVKTELWMDPEDDNTWVRASFAEDIQTGTFNGYPNGTWTTNDPVPAACPWGQGYVVRSGTTPARESWVTFRADSATILIDRLSVREIDPAARIVQP